MYQEATKKEALARLFFFFLQLEPVLAVVHDLADGRVGRGGDLDQIHLLFAGHGQRLAGGHDTQLFAGGADHSDLFVANALIEFKLFLFLAANRKTPPK